MPVSTERAGADQPNEPGVLSDELPLPAAQFTDGSSITLRALIERGERLAPMPDAVARLLKMLEDPECRIGLIVEQVERDQGLAAAVLRMANSVFYRRLREVTALDLAVTRIGLSTVRDLALAATMFRSGTAAAPLLRELREEMLATAAGARILSTHVDGMAAGTAFAAGLFLSVGRYTLALLTPAAYGEVRAVAARTNTPLDEIESRWLGISQGRIGSTLVSAWGFPEALVNVLALQTRFARTVDNADLDTRPYIYVAAAVLARDLAEVIAERAPVECASLDALLAHPSQRVLNLEEGTLRGLYEEVRTAASSMRAVFGSS